MHAVTASSQPRISAREIVIALTVLQEGRGMDLLIMGGRDAGKVGEIGIQDKVNSAKLLVTGYWLQATARLSREPHHQ